MSISYDDNHYTIYIYTRGVLVNAVGNGHSDANSDPGGTVYANTCGDCMNPTLLYVASQPGL